jgi:hypothetical protein
VMGARELVAAWKERTFPGASLEPPDEDLISAISSLLEEQEQEHERCVDQIQADQLTAAERENELHDEKDAKIARLENEVDRLRGDLQLDETPPEENPTSLSSKDEEIAARCQCDGCSACAPHVCRPEWPLVVFCQHCYDQRLAAHTESLRAALEDIVCLDDSCEHTEVFCAARKAQRALRRGPDVVTQ